MPITNAIQVRNVQTGELTVIDDDREPPAPPSTAERAALITLPRLEFEGALTAALKAAGAQVTLPTVGAYVDGALNASTDLTDDEKETARWIFKSAATFTRGDGEVVIDDPETTAKQLLEKSAAVLGFGAGSLGEDPTWNERIAAASAALDSLYLIAAGQS